VQLKPQDVLVALKLSLRGPEEWGYATLAAELELSIDEAHNAIRRLGEARLYNVHSRTVIRASLEECLVHGVRYAFPAKRGAPTRGVPTAWAAAPLKELLVEFGDLPPVWPHPEGTIRGFEVAPLYKTVVAAAIRDSKLYELLALVDEIRLGGARERRLAEELLHQRLTAII
jgi:hypothetical protein